jgi:hypothetical protein
MAHSPEGNGGDGENKEGENADDLSWMYGNPDDDLFDDKGNLKLGPYGFEDLFETSETDERHPRGWDAEAPPEADPPHSEG